MHSKGEHCKRGWGKKGRISKAVFYKPFAINACDEYRA